MKSLNFGTSLGRSEMKKLMAGGGSCNPAHCNSCTAYGPGDPPCYKFSCQAGFCVPEESTCCITVGEN